MTDGNSCERSEAKRPKLTETERKLKLASVGCGIIFKHHIDAIAACTPRRVTITAVIEPNVERRAAAIEMVRVKLGDVPRGFASLVEAFAADPEKKLFEAVDLMVPSLGTVHEEVALEVQRNGRHILLEKPIALSIASGERVIASGRKLCPDKVLMVAENSQYWHEVVTAKSMIDKGLIGEVLSVRAKFWESAHPVLNEWARDGSYDAGSFYCEGPEGFVFDGGLHWLRPLRMLLGMPTRVAAVAGKTIPHMKGPGMTHALLTFDSGATAVFESVLAPAAISDQPFFVIQGSLGEIVLDGFEGGGRLYTVSAEGQKETSINEGHTGPIGWDTGYVGEIQDFAAAVLDGKRLEADAQEAVEDLRLMLAIMKSAKTRSWEMVADVEPHLDMASLGLKL